MRRVTLLGDDRAIGFAQEGAYLRMRGMPARDPDRVLGVPVLRIACAGPAHP